MTFNLRIAGSERSVTTQSFEATNAGHTALKAALPEILAKAGKVTSYHLSIATSDFSEEQVVQFICLVQKCWRHLTFVGGFTVTEIRHSECWQTYQTTPRSIPFQKMIKGYLSKTFERFEYADGVFTIKAPVASSPPEVVLSFARRFTNMALWVERNGCKIKLSGPDFLRWKMFDDISKYQKPGFTRLNRAVAGAVPTAVGVATNEEDEEESDV